MTLRRIEYLVVIDMCLHFAFFSLSFTGRYFLSIDEFILGNKGSCTINSPQLALMWYTCK